MQGLNLWLKMPGWLPFTTGFYPEFFVYDNRLTPYLKERKWKKWLQ